MLKSSTTLCMIPRLGTLDTLISRHRQGCKYCIFTLVCYGQLDNNGAAGVGLEDNEINYFKLQKYIYILLACLKSSAECSSPYTYVDRQSGLGAQPCSEALLLEFSVSHCSIVLDSSEGKVQLIGSAITCHKQAIQNALSTLICKLHHSSFRQATCFHV